MRNSVLCGLLGLGLLGTTLSVVAEDLTLTTAYPSPRGVYQELRATQNTYLAYDTTGTTPYSVGIGTTNASARLTVQGSGTTATTTALQVTNSTGTSTLLVRDDGRVGIGTSNPQATVDINNGNIKITDGNQGDGRVLTSDATGVASWQPAALPSGAVMFFTLSSCPSGWSALGAAQGRYLVGLPAGGTLGGTEGTPLTNLENRSTGSHVHGVVNLVHTHDVTYSVNSGSGPLIPDGGYYKSGSLDIVTSPPTYTVQPPTGSVAGTNAPYLQLLVCRKD